jgi:hypothetical protein
MFSFPDDAIWNDGEDAVQFTLVLGEYEGTVYVGRRVLHGLIGNRPTPEQCLEHFHMYRTEFERIAEAKVRARALEADATIRITGRDVQQFGAG